MLPLFSVLVFDLTFDLVVEGEDVPGVVSLWLNLTLSSALDACLCELHGVLVVSNGGSSGRARTTACFQSARSGLNLLESDG